MSAGEAAAKSAAPYVVGAGVLLGVGYLAYTKLLPDVGKAVTDAVDSAKKAVKKQLAESNAAVTKIRDTGYNDYSASGGTLTVLPDIQTQDRFWTTQPKDGYTDFNQFLDKNLGAAKLPINLVQVADNALGTGLLKSAAQDGVNFRIALEKRGDVARLENLNSVERALVLSGQAISSIVGKPIYEANTDVGGCPIGYYRPLFAEKCIKKSGDTMTNLKSWISGGLW